MIWPMKKSRIESRHRISLEQPYTVSSSYSYRDSIKQLCEARRSSTSSGSNSSTWASTSSTPETFACFLNGAMIWLLQLRQQRDSNNAEDDWVGPTREDCVDSTSSDGRQRDPWSMGLLQTTQRRMLTSGRGSVRDDKCCVCRARTPISATSSRWAESRMEDDVC